MQNKKRLIDANALMDAFRSYMVDRYDSERCVSEENCKTCENLCLWRKIVSVAPTVDAVEVDTAILVVLQIALEAIRQYRKTVGHDPIFEFSPKEINKIANYARSMLNGSSETENEELADHLMTNGVTLQQVPRFFISDSHKKDITDLDLNTPILVQPDTMTITPIGNRWIPVKERLPEKGKYVLCLKDTGDMWVAEWDYVDDQLWTDHESWCSKDVVTHWMPLPEPPKGGPL